LVSALLIFGARTCVLMRTREVSRISNQTLGCRKEAPFGPTHLLACHTHDPHTHSHSLSFALALTHERSTPPLPPPPKKNKTKQRVTQTPNPNPTPLRTVCPARCHAPARTPGGVRPHTRPPSRRRPGGRARWSGGWARPPAPPSPQSPIYVGMGRQEAIVGYFVGLGFARLSFGAVPRAHGPARTTITTTTSPHTQHTPLLTPHSSSRHISPAARS
jgi:hypothetical protein